MLTYENTISKIFQKIKKTPFDIQLYEDCFSLIRVSLDEDIRLYAFGFYLGRGDFL